jgi:hypothetical protein
VESQPSLLGGGGGINHRLAFLWDESIIALLSWGRNPSKSCPTSIAALHCWGEGEDSITDFSLLLGEVGEESIPALPCWGRNPSQPYAAGGGTHHSLTQVGGEGGGEGIHHRLTKDLPCWGRNPSKSSSAGERIPCSLTPGERNQPWGGGGGGGAGRKTPPPTK